MFVVKGKKRGGGCEEDKDCEDFNLKFCNIDTGKCFKCKEASDCVVPEGFKEGTISTCNKKGFCVLAAPPLICVVKSGAPSLNSWCGSVYKATKNCPTKDNFCIKVAKDDKCIYGSAGSVGAVCDAYEGNEAACTTFFEGKIKDICEWK